MGAKHKIGLGIISAVFVYLFIFVGVSLVELIRTESKHPVKAFATDGKALRVFDRDTGVYYPKIFHSRDMLIDGQKAFAWIKNGKVIVQIGEKKITHPVNTAKIPIWSPTKPELYYLDSLADYPRKKQIWKWSQAKGFEAITDPQLDLSYLVFSVDGDHLTTFNNRYIDHLVNRMMVWSTSGKLECTYETSNAITRTIMIGSDDYLLAPMNTSTFQRQHPSVAHAFRFNPTSKKLSAFKVDGRQVRDVIALDGQVWVMFQKPNIQLTTMKVSRGDDKISVARLDKSLTHVVEEFPLDPKK